VDQGEFPIRAHTGVPLIIGNELVGTLELASYTPGTFTQASVATLQTVAAQAAVAIQNARLFQETRRRAEEMTALREAAVEVTGNFDQEHVLNSIVQRATDLLKGQGGVLYKVDADKQCLTVLVSYRLRWELTKETLQFGEGVSGQVAQKRQPLIVNDYEHWEGNVLRDADIPFNAVIGVPVIWQDELVGVLNVLTDTAQRPFDDNDLRLLTLFASQAAGALQTANLYEQLVRRVEETSALRETAMDISSELDSDRLLETIVRRAVALLHARGGSLHRYDPLSQTLRLIVSFNMGRDYRGIVLSKGEGLAGSVLDGQQPIIVNDYRTWSKRSLKFDDSAFTAAIGVPLIWQDKLLGALVVLDNIEQRAFNLNDLRMLTMFAAQASVGIQNADLYQETRRRAEQSARLTRISAIAASTLDLDELMRRMMAETVALLEAEKGIVLLLDEQRQKLMPHPAAFYGVSVEQMGDLALDAGADDFGFSVVRMGRLFRSDNARTDRRIIPAYRTFIERFGVTTLISAPLTVKDRAFGELHIANRRSGPFTDQDAQLLETVAGVFTSAIQNAQLYAETRRRVTELNTLTDIGRALSSTLNVDELLRLVYEQTQRVMHAENMFIALYDETHDEVEFALSINQGEVQPGSRRSARRGLTGHIIQTHQTLFTRGAEQLREFMAQQGIELIGGPLAASWLGVPMLVGDRILGVLVVQHYENPNAYDDTHRELLEAIAAQSAIALENARLYQLTDVRLQERVEELTALASITRELNSTLQMERIFDLVLDGAMQATGAEYSSIYLLDAERQRLQMRAMRGYEATMAPADQALGEGVIGRTVVTGQPIVVDDVAQDPNYLAVIANVRSELCVPISYAGSVVGAINLESPLIAAFHEDDVSFVSALAAQAAIAIGNTQRLEEQMQRGELLRRRAEQLSNLFAISQAFRSNQPLENVLDDVAHAIQETVGFDVVVISLVEGDPSTPGALMLRRVAAAGVPVTVFEEMKATRSPWAVAEAAMRDEFRISQSYYFPAERLEVVAGMDTYETSKIPPGPRQPGQWHPNDMLLIPLRGSDGQPLGMISVDDPRDRRIPTRSTIETFEVFANQAAVAIENNRLYADMERRVQERTEDLRQALGQLTDERDRVETLYRITSELSASLDLDRVLNRTLTLLTSVIGAPRGSILLVDEQTNILIHRASLGRAQAMERAHLPPGGEPTSFQRNEGLAGWVIQYRQSVIIPDVLADERWIKKLDKISDHRSALAVPLMTSDDVLGALLLFHPRENFFTEDHLRLVEAAARQVAVSINNAELYRLIREQAERLGSMLRAQQEEASKIAWLLEAVADGVMVANAQGRVILYNAAAEQILGARRDEIIGRPTDDLLGLYGSAGVSWSAQVHRWLMSASARSEVPSIEQRLEIENQYIAVHVAPVTLGDEYLGTVSIFRDMTKEVEVDRAKSDFVSTVSHEMRTPMTSIKGYADLMLLGAAGAMNENQKRFLGIIKANADRLTVLVNDLLDIGRIEGGRVELDIKPLPLEELVDYVANSLRGKIEEKGLKLFVNLPPDLPQVMADRDRAIQILTNLVSNAYQYTRPGGSITVKALWAESVVQIDVSDTGIGIAPENQVKVFDRFFRADDPDVQEFSGTGLGLAIVKSLIEMMHGHIWLESELDKGTTFSFMLPAARAAPAEGEAKPETAPAAPRVQTIVRQQPQDSQRRVLVVEDDANIAQLISHHLQEGGYQVSTVGRAEEAFQAARRERPDLITLDIYLPGADGFELLQTLKSDEATADIPVVIVSVLADKKHGLRLGAVDYLTKPIDDNLLMETVSRVLSGAGKVLIVDDDRDTLELLRHALSGMGFQVRTTTSGRRAMQLVREEKPDLILLDLKLPGEMDGYQVLTQLKRNVDTAGVPIIVITGSLTDQEIKQKKVLALGADRFLTKPFEIDELVAEIRQFMGEGQAVE
jgi:PAS domain S-box-containing protein